MIHAELYSQALQALQRLLVHAKAQAYEAGNDRLAELLNDMELLPEFLADEADRTGEFLEMLQGLGQMHPSCRYIVEGFERIATSAT